MISKGLVLSAVLIVAALGAPGVAAAQSDTVTLTVSVVTPSGAAVGGASLTATWDGGNASATTASNGKAFVDVPKGAKVSIAVSHPDWVRNDAYTVTPTGDKAVSITVYHKGSATISVRDANGPVDGATVSLQKRGETAVTGTTSGGSMDTGVVEQGDYTVVVTKPGYYRKRLDLQVGNDTTKTVTLTRGTVTLRVNVTDGYFSPPKPIQGATATIPNVGSIETQADGIQRIGVPVNTNLDVNVTKDGYQPVHRVVDVGESDVAVHVNVSRTPTLNASLLSGQVVVGQQALVHVRDEYGDPVANASVLVDGSAVAETGPDGTATLTVASAGEHAVTVRKDGLTSTAVTLTGVVPAESTSAGSTTTAATSTTVGNGTATTSSSVPGVPGFGIQLVVVGVALVAVLFGIRAWQRR